MSELRSMAEMAGIAYEGRELPESLAYDRHWFLEDRWTGAACHVILRGSVLYVLPRGVEPRDYRDWVTVLRGGSRDFSGLPGKVHRGMALAYESLEHQLIPRVIECIVDDPCLEIRLCGHSMGGALSRFAHWRLLNLTPRVRSWTFGAPGQFSAQAAHRWNIKCESTNVHLVNGADFVPWIARPAGWHQGGAFIYLDSDHGRNTGWSRWKLWRYRLRLMFGRGPLSGGLEDHKIETYIRVLGTFPEELTRQTPGVHVGYEDKP